MNNQVLFLRKLKPGGSAHSFGIHVAKMAGMPPWILDRSQDILNELEAIRATKSDSKKLKTNTKNAPQDDYQLSFIQLDDPLLFQIKQEILKTDINTLTPVEALMKLNDIKKMLGE